MDVEVVREVKFTTTKEEQNHYNETVEILELLNQFCFEEGFETSFTKELDNVVDFLKGRLSNVFFMEENIKMDD